MCKFSGSSWSNQVISIVMKTWEEGKDLGWGQSAQEVFLGFLAMLRNYFAILLPPMAPSP